MTDVDAKVPELRKRFLDKYSGSILDDTYDERDVDRVKKDDRLLRATLRAYRSGPGNVEKATDLLNKSLLFRAKYKLNDLKKEDLNQELAERNGVYWKGKDKGGRNLLHFKVHKQKKGNLIEESRQFISFHVNQCWKENPEEQIVCIFDFMDAGVTNMDLDISRFIVDAFAWYFPNFSAYNLMFKMPLAIEAIYKIISGWMDADQSKKTHFVTRSTIQQYIPQDQLEKHMIKEETEKKK